MPDEGITSTMDTNVMSDEAFQEALASGSFPQAETTPEVEPEVDAAPPATDAAEIADSPAEVPVEKKDPVKAMEAELGRQRERARTLEQEVAFLKGKTEAQETPQSDPLKSATPDTLINAQLQWEEEMAAARAEGRSEDLAKARNAVAQIRMELHRRTTEEAVTHAKQGTETERLSQQIQAVTKRGIETLPALADPTSAISQAAQAQVQHYPDLLGKLGDVGQIVAIGLAILENPALVAQKANQELVKNLNKVADKTLAKGAGGVDLTKPTTRIPTDKQEFEHLVEAVRAGTKTFADLQTGD